MVRLATWVGAAFIGIALALAPAATARTQRLYIAVGDSVTNSGVPGAGWVDLYYRYLHGEAHGGATRFVRLSSSTSGDMVRRGGGVDQTIKLIDEPSNTIAVTVTTGGNDALQGGCWLAPACPFPGNLAAILDRLNAALAKDPGAERLAILAYYNPESDKGTPLEASDDQTLLGSDQRIDCSISGAAVGLNDDIACIGWQNHWVVVDAWPGFKAGGQPLLDGGIHPSVAGHALIANLFENACDLPAAAPGVPDPDGFLAARPANGGLGCLAAAPIPDQIAFTHFGTDPGIYMVNADGSQLTRLNVGGRDPAWAPSAGRFAYANQVGILVASANGAIVRRVKGPGATQPAWSPDGKRIAFVQRGSLYTVDFRGHHLRRLTRPPRLRKPRVQARDSQPAWSPDGKRIAFVENRGGCDDSIWTVTPSGRAKHRLTPRPKVLNSALSPDWSADGSTIAYTFPVNVQHACQGAQRALWVMKANGKSRHVLSAPAGLSAHDPSWSPDGSMMAFSASPPGTTNLGIYVLDIASGTVRQLTAPADPGQPGDATPAWRPLAP